MFDIVWLQSALDDLAAVWVGADSALRRAVTAAAHRIEGRLRVNPQAVGESREGNERRIVFEAPLAATFEVLPQQRLVRVTHVWSIRRGG